MPSQRVRQLFVPLPDRRHNDLAPDPTHTARLTHWRNELIDRLAGREEGFTDGTRLIPGRPVQATLSHLSGRLRHHQ